MRGAFALHLLGLGILFVAQGECLDSVAWKKALDIAYRMFPGTSPDDLDASLSEIHPHLVYAPPDKKFSQLRTKDLIYPVPKPENILQLREPSFNQPITSQSTLNFASEPHVHVSTRTRDQSQKFISQATEFMPQNLYHTTYYSDTPGSLVQVPVKSASTRNQQLQQYYLNSGNIQDGFALSGTHQMSSVSAPSLQNSAVVHRRPHVRQNVQHSVVEHQQRNQQSFNRGRRNRGKQQLQTGQTENIQSKARPQLNIYNRQNNHHKENRNFQDSKNWLNYVRNMPQFSHNENARPTITIQQSRGRYPHPAQFRNRDPTVLRLDEIVDIHQNLPSFIEGLNSKSKSEEKKTYLIFKAPSLVTTQRPASAPYAGRAPYTPAPRVKYDTQRETQPPVVNHQQGNAGIVVDVVALQPIAEENPNPNINVLNTDFNSQSNAEQSTYNSDVKNSASIVGGAQDIQVTQPVIHFPAVLESFQPASHSSNSNVKNSRAPEAGYYNYIAPPDEQFQTLPPQINYNSESDNRHTVITPADNNYSNGVPTVRQNTDITSFTPVLSPNTANGSQPIVSYSPSISVSVNKNPSPPKAAPKKPPRTSKKKSKPYTVSNYGGTGDSYGSENVPGRPGSDYPVYNEIPFTNFDCSEYKAPGFYADLEAGCQVFHNCDMGMKKHSFMCPNGTIFRQELFICDWWYNVRCDDSPEYYGLNGGLYDDKQPSADKVLKAQ